MNLSGWRSGKRLFHLHGNGQFDVFQVDVLLLSVVGVRLCVIEYSSDMT